MKNKLAHTLVLAVFAIACKWLSAILTLAARAGHGHLLISGAPLQPILIVLPVFAATYCLWIWSRKADRLPSWVVFFAATTSILVLLTLMTLIAAYQPVINVMNELDSLRRSRPTAAAGQKAPTFQTKTIDGRLVDFPGDYKGKIVLLDFWATWCPSCRAEVPNVAAAYQQYHTNGFDVLNVSLDKPGNGPALQQFIRDHKMTWSHVYDGGFLEAAVAVQYGVQGIPCPVLVDGDTGVILAVGPDVLSPGLTNLLQVALTAKVDK
jgi:peroxiredoxin